MNKQPRYVLRTLEFVNKLRKVIGDKPLDDLKNGTPCNPRDCPITNSISYNISSCINIFTSNSIQLESYYNHEHELNYIATKLYSNNYFKKYLPYEYNENNSVIFIKLPKYICEFISKMDNKKLPQYIKR